MSFLRKVREGLRSLRQTRFVAQRHIPEAVSKQQIEEEIPVSWKADNMLWGYVNRYMLKGSGAGFVTPPYMAYWDSAQLSIATRQKSLLSTFKNWQDKWARHASWRQLTLISSTT